MVKAVITRKEVVTKGADPTAVVTWTIMMTGPVRIEITEFQGIIKGKVNGVDLNDEAAQIIYHELERDWQMSESAAYEEEQIAKYRE